MTSFAHLGTYNNCCTRICNALLFTGYSKQYPESLAQRNNYWQCMCSQAGMVRRGVSRLFVYFSVRFAIRGTAEECEKFVEYVKRIEAAPLSWQPAASGSRGCRGPRQEMRADKYYCLTTRWGQRKQWRQPRNTNKCFRCRKRKSLPTMQ